MISMILGTSWNVSNNGDIHFQGCESQSIFMEYSCKNLMFLLPSSRRLIRGAFIILLIPRRSSLGQNEMIRVCLQTVPTTCSQILIKMKHQNALKFLKLSSMNFVAAKRKKLNEESIKGLKYSKVSYHVQTNGAQDHWEVQRYRNVFPN